MSISSPPLCPTITVCPLADAVVERHGFPVRSVYAEALWLPILGPSALWALRRLAAMAVASPEGCAVDLAELASSLGLSAGTGRNSIIVRTLSRLVHFGMAEWDGSTLRVRTAVAPLRQTQLTHVGPPLRRLHDTLVASRRAAAVHTG